MIPDGKAEGQPCHPEPRGRARARGDDHDQTALRHARERLAQAVRELEGAIDPVCEKLDTRAKDLNAARDECTALRETQEMLSTRLDAAIGRLRSLLGEA